MLAVGHAGELDLGLLGGLLQSLQGHTVAAQIDAVLRLEVVGQVVDDALIEVITAEVVVAGGGEAPAGYHRPISMIETSKVPPPRS